MLQGKIFPSGNGYELPKIMSNLNDLKMDYKVKMLGNGGFIVYFHQDQVGKLPTDDLGPFLPLNENGGYPIYEIDEKEIE